MDTPTYISYPVTFSNEQVSGVIAKIEEATQDVKDQDLIIVSLLVMIIGLSDPGILSDEERFRETLDNISNHISWVLRTPIEMDPQKMN